MADLLTFGKFAAPAFVVATTIPVVWKFGKNLRSPRQVKSEGLYEDRDGKATEESMKAYSTKKQFIVIFIGLGIGIAASFALLVNTFIQALEFNDPPLIWATFACWILALIQVLSVFRETRIVPRYQQGLLASFSFLFLAALNGIIISGENERIDYPGAVLLPVTSAIQFLSALAVFLGFISIQRRPDVFTPESKVVERQYTSSLWTKYSYDWSSDILDLSAKKLVEFSDLPAMDSYRRAKDVKETFQSIVLKPTVSLWLQIFWAWKWQLVYQAVMCIVSSAADVLPQISMLKLLEYLEQRKETGIIDPKAWVCVVLLFLATIVETVVDYRIGWLMWSDLGIPIRTTLTTLMFEKMMKIKDCKEPPKEEKADEKDKDANGKPTDDTKLSKADARKKDEKKKKAAQSEQDIINMFAVDTNQVGVFGAINQFYLLFVSKLSVSVVFLWYLVGWQSLLAGMVSILLVFPVNKWLTYRYGAFQKKLMAIRDKKTKVVSEALQGIRQIKFSANEPEWTAKINKARDEELAQLWQTKLNNLYMMLGAEIGPVLLTVSTLATFAWLKGTLLPSVAFTALGVLMQLEGVLGMLPFLLVLGINAKVSCDRIDAFLKQPEKPENTLPGDSIIFNKASVSFPSKSILEEKDEDLDEEEAEAARLALENRFVLRDLNLEFPNHSLSVISGPTGSGKSLLLAAMLGEVDLLEGNITVPRAPPVDQRFDSKATAADWIIPSSIAFVAQTPWIENMSIKDNILFGLPYDENRYNKVLNACAMAKDLTLFDDGDQTEVGAQGISLSGGQKWRLTLARAFYSRAGILILDDVFSALDAHVGKHIYDNALMGELSEGRTRILATHHVSLTLARAQYAVCLSANGTLEHAGLVEELQKSGSFDNILKAVEEEGSEQKQNEEADKPAPDGETNGTAKDDKKVPKKLVEDEARETGGVKRSVYITYLKATGGIPFWGFVLSFYIIAQGLTLSRSWWIKIWTTSTEQTTGPAFAQSYGLQTHFAEFSSPVNTSFATTSPAGNYADLASWSISSTFSMLTGYIGSSSVNTVVPSSQPMMVTSKTVSTSALPIEINDRSLGFYLVGYVIISLVSTLIDVGRYYVVFRGSLRASRKVFQELTYRVLRTPLRWLDTVPTGRILNRFTADFQAVDSQLSSNFASVAASFLGILGILVSAVIISPYIIFLALVILALCGRVGLRYIRGARSIKRLESIQKSPMISHFSASLQGLSTIRAFANQEVFEKRMDDLINSYSTATWHNWLFNNWVGYNMALIGSIFSGVVAAFVVSTPHVGASLGGFALAFSLQYRRAVNMTLRQVAATELDMNAAERIFEYSALNIETEKGVDVRASWPEKGELEVKDLEVGYAEGLPSILKGLNFHAEMNQRVGIVGRTGAGKSTLSLALFRFLEARKGSITIDGVDISTVRLHDLRTRLAIIPQDPVLFSGTIRSNLDPFDQFSDFQLHEALQRVHLVPSANNTPVPELLVPESSASPTEGASSATSLTAAEPNGNKENTNIFLSLTSPISSAGANLSQGQKQLLCLARAILSRPKVLLLDEATSAVDKNTDKLIQRSIREEFANTTLLVVAHRLSTVMDFDRILVMREGVAAEFGTPAELLKIEEGVFKGMVAQSGEKEELEKMVEVGEQ
ncbi:P-loop containing nucleoside triphosphate hydrolase protein [Stipitochalara longipes BDJ]|nr:P-loop containing nucleoside triphosphate hydrolase protein [Stipitochalara longipes BDJ]